jgi:hypothetical protein
MKAPGPFPDLLREKLNETLEAVIAGVETF